MAPPAPATPTAGRPVVALLTDFGLSDHYVGTMKGVVLGVCPDAVLVDVTHDIPPQDLVSAAYVLHASSRYFPPGTVFVVVVDPGVGSGRRAIAARCGDHTFVAPDNGVLSRVLDATAPAAVVELTEPQYARPSISRTFEGRDRFAPAAAWIARGTPLDALGSRVTDWIRLDLPRPEITPDGVRGEVVRVDRFGNAITNIDRASLQTVAHANIVRLGDHVIPIVETYADVAHGEVCALLGSADDLEIAVNGGSAAAQLHLARGATLIVTR